MKSIYRLLSLLILLSALIVFFFLRDRQKQLKFGREIENEITATFKRNNLRIRNEKVVNHHGRWFEVIRDIDVGNKEDYEKVKGELDKDAAALHASVKYSETDESTMGYQISMRSRVFEKIFFHLPRINKIAIVIDDVGFRKDLIDDFLALDIPITFSIFPADRYSKQVAEKLIGKKYHYLMHLPLEPLTYNPLPEKTKITTDMPEPEIEKRFNRDLDSLVSLHDGTSDPVGLNNHMGSKFTGDYAKMKILLGLVKKRNIFFLDSATNPKSVGRKVAGELGLPFLKNSIFLDSMVEENAIEKQFLVLIKIAQKQGSAIGIGHIYNRPTLEVLRKHKDDIGNYNCRFVFAQELIGTK